ncbi:hypothetical protein V2J09_002747, partial [Rumex salicifolius]
CANVYIYWSTCHLIASSTFFPIVPTTRGPEKDVEFLEVGKMAPAGKIAEFRKEGSDWFCNAGLPSDVTVVVDGVHFHLHKFPLVSRCKKIIKGYDNSEKVRGGVHTISLEEFPGGPDVFLVTAKFCYGLRTELIPKNIVVLYCAADYLEMIDEYGEDNLLSKCEGYFHKSVLRDWKSCILALRSSEPVIRYAEKLQIVSKCSIAIATMVCTDPSLFGWPMMMYGSLQSPGGSILWNGINTGARIRSVEPDWWYEDISYLCVVLFERLIKTMEMRGLRPESIAGAIMHYARKYLPGLRRWQGGGKSGQTRSVTSFSMTAPLIVDQRLVLESIVKLLPEKKGRGYCKFLLSLLRVAMILGVSQDSKDSLERRIGLQLDLVTLDGLLIPTYSDADTLYDTDCVQRIIEHFLLSDSARIPMFSPSSLEINGSPSSEPLKQVARLVDGYIAEVASDVNLKPDKLRALMQALPEDSRSLHDGLYRALDIYFKEHPWLSDKDKEELSNIMEFHKLSVDACAHASQNDRLPLRIVLQVLFFEQLHLRNAVTRCLNNPDPETGPARPASNEMAGQLIQRDGWVTVVNRNRGLKLDMDRMTSRVAELEQEFGEIKEEVKKVNKSVGYLSSPRLIIRRLGCRLLPRSIEAQSDVVERTVPHTPTAQPSRRSRHRKSVSLFD